MINAISLGAGVQSTTMALMAAAGEITPMPDAAIFADTGWEPEEVYRHLDWLTPLLPFPVYRVMHKDGLLAAITGDGRFASAPFFTSNGGMSPRQCTAEFKIRPIQKKLREVAGYAPRKRIPPGHIISWIGISTDEADRMRPSRERWIQNRFPLIEADMTRWHCIQWLSKHGYPQAPKSACLGCPYHSDEMWERLKTGSPAEWAATVKVDETIRTRGRQRGLHSDLYMHRSLRPLDQVDFSGITNQQDLFSNECEGMCGL